MWKNEIEEMSKAESLGMDDRSRNASIILGEERRMKETSHITTEQVAAINAALEKNYRVELIPLKDGVKIVKVSRAEIKAK
jgi:hypothetical protein